MDIQGPEIFVRRMAEWTSTWVGTPSKSNSKIAKISEFWGPERISKYICQLSNIISYFDMKKHEILAF